MSRPLSINARETVYDEPRVCFAEEGAHICPEDWT